MHKREIYKLLRKHYELKWVARQEGLTQKEVYALMRDEIKWAQEEAAKVPDQLANLGVELSQVVGRTGSLVHPDYGFIRPGESFVKGWVEVRSVTTDGWVSVPTDSIRCGLLLDDGRVV